jgi:nitrite reductase/ring-hydroxylating ferredoxin subunit
VREGYQRVAALAEVPDGGCLAVELDGLALALIRRGDRVTAFENRCPHAGAPLSEGFVEGDRLTCAWHGWSFDLDTGVSPDDPEMIVLRLETVVEDGDVLVRK